MVEYNNYRSTSSGSYSSPIKSSLDATLAYTENTATSGEPYSYVVKAADRSNLESGALNEVQAVIPTPEALDRLVERRR